MYDLSLNVTEIIQLMRKSVSSNNRALGFESSLVGFTLETTLAEQRLPGTESNRRVHLRPSAKASLPEGAISGSVNTRT